MRNFKKKLTNVGCVDFLHFCDKIILIKSRISNGTLLINRYYSLNICRLRKKHVILLS